MMVPDFGCLWEQFELQVATANYHPEVKIRAYEVLDALKKLDEGKALTEQGYRQQEMLIRARMMEFLSLLTQLNNAISAGDCLEVLHKGQMLGNFLATMEVIPRINEAYNLGLFEGKNGSNDDDDKDVGGLKRIIFLLCQQTTAQGKDISHYTEAWAVEHHVSQRSIQRIVKEWKEFRALTTFH